GTVHRDQIATLKGDVEREKADVGIFISFERPTAPMIDEAVKAGNFEAFGGLRYPKIQILSVEQLLLGEKPKLPPIESYHKEAKEVKRDIQHSLGV
ncbi:MAG: Adenine specific DNA methylase Mod, partial [Parcubacteria group bacterium GW2011_GWB1_45_7]